VQHDFYTQLQAMPEEERKLLLEQLGMDYAGQATALDPQMTAAQGLRDTPMPEGRSVRGGYVASNPLEFVGAGMQKYQGQQQLKGLQGQQTALQGKGNDLRAKLMAQMLRGGGGGAGGGAGGTGHTGGGNGGGY